MTTTVTVNAHCDSKTTQVLVHTKEGEEFVSFATLEDGESREFHAYDDREIIVKEVIKTVDGCAAESAA